METEAVLVLLYSAQAFFCLACIGLLIKLFLSKNILSDRKILSISVSSIVITVLVFLSLIGYNSISYYDCYTPVELLSKSEKYSYNKIFPCHDISDIEPEYLSVNFSHITGTEYVSVEKYGYYFEYVESLSPFIIFSYRAERFMPTAFNSRYCTVLSSPEIIEIDGKKVKVFSTDSAYAVYFKNFNRTVYAEITNISGTGVTREEFAKTVIEQAELFENAMDEKVFLDIPFNKKLEKYISVYG